MAKTATIFGLGLYPEGSGIAASKYLLEQGYDLIITDLRTSAQLQEQSDHISRFRKQKKLKNQITYHLEGHRKSDFSSKKTDLIVKNPAIPPHSPYLKEAARQHIPITSDTAIFLEHFPGTVIGITGTRGKSTTTQLIYEILKHGKKPVIIGGNIAISPLKYLSETGKDHIAVLELPAQQLQALTQVKKAPHIGVITNILPDHLNFYTTARQYVNEKKRLFTHQTKHDFAIFNFDNPKTRALAARQPAAVFYFSTKKLPKKYFGVYEEGERIFFRNKRGEQRIISNSREIKLPGDHNQANALAAIAATVLLQAPLTHIKKVLKTFSGLPFRLQQVAEKNKIIFFNDSTATTPDGTLAAITTLSGQYPRHALTLIAGGIAKVPDYRALTGQIEKKVRHLILLPGTAADKITRHMPKNSAVVVSSAKNLGAAVTLARKKTPQPGIILLSPAAASFNQFLNEYERGEQFNQLIRRA